MGHVDRYETLWSDIDYCIATDAGGWLVQYAAMQHFYKEALAHGLSLAEAIEAMERENGV